MSQNKTREEVHSIIQKRIDSNLKRIDRLHPYGRKADKFEMEQIRHLTEEVKLLESVLNALCDGRPTDVILETNFCFGR